MEPGRQLHQRFLRLGELDGRTCEQIISAVGDPCAVVPMSEGRILLEWQATGCRMGLLFDCDRRFVDVAHEFAQYGPVASDSGFIDTGAVRVVTAFVGIVAVLGLLINMM